MTNQETIVEKLSQINNVSITKKQWDIVLKGCSCPKSTYFWAALRQNNLIKNNNIYTLVDIDYCSFLIIWEQYCINNRESVKRAYYKAKAKEKAKKRSTLFKGFTLYMINGTLTTEKPEID